MGEKKRKKKLIGTLCLSCLVTFKKREKESYAASADSDTQKDPPHPSPPPPLSSFCPSPRNSTSEKLLQYPSNTLHPCRI